MLKEDINIARKLSGIIRFLLILFVSTLAINASPNNIENQPTTLYIGNVEVTLGDGECIKPSNSTSLNTKRRTSTKNTNQTVRHIHSSLLVVMLF